jgi:stearoyl-CoA desaturase (delta-9 desaturase)
MAHTIDSLKDMLKNKLVFFYYQVAWMLLVAYWAIDVQVWLYGLVVGWLFHMIICSVILHKYFTHKTYKVNKLTHYIFAYLGTLSLNGSVLAWVNLHRLHHTTSDRCGDPHDPSKIGLIKSMFVLDMDRYSNNRELSANLKNCKDLLQDKWIVFLHRHLFEVLTVTYLLLGLISVNAVVVLLIGTSVSFIGLFFTTYVYHKKIPLLHYRNHKTKDVSYNNYLTGIMFPGEAYHNNHHNNPTKYDTAEQWYELDITSWFITLIKKRN